MQIDKAKKVLGECTGTKIDIKLAVSRVHGLQAHAMGRLTELNNELPKALAARSLQTPGEEEGEAKRIKAEISKNEEILKDAPLALEELARMQAANNQRIKEAQAVILKYDLMSQYETSKDDLRTNSYSEVEVGNKLCELRKLSHHVDHWG